MKNALAPPFNIERLLNTADAEYGGELPIAPWFLPETTY
jgi:hypothetical protein